MKQQDVLRACGWVQQPDGLWQMAEVESDGDALVSVVALGVADRPVADCALVGVDGADLSALPPDLKARVVSGFREADRQMGGQGDPLIAPYLHALMRHLGVTGPSVFLSSGKTCQMIWVDPAHGDIANSQALLAFDAGPGPDVAGHAQDAGQVVDGALELFLDDPYFRKLPPKWVTPDNFTQMLSLVAELPAPDARATLLGMSAMAVMLGIEHLPAKPARLVLLDQPDPVFVNMLAASVGVPVMGLTDLGVEARTLHAQSAAYLAIRVAQGLPTTYPNTTGVAAAVGGGTITDFS